MQINGMYANAVVHTDSIEEGARRQIEDLCNQPMARDAHIRIMPDVHAGAGCVIGYTARMTDRTVPNLIGVDIGCGVASWRIGKRDTSVASFKRLDEVIRRTVPSGRKVHRSFMEEDAEHVYNRMRADKPFGWFLKRITDVCRRTGQNEEYVLRSVGTLGGGNHFIELDQDEEKVQWLTIHSGSRNFGLRVAQYHQKIARNQSRGENAGTVTGLEYLEGKKRDEYHEDMRIAQTYAALNRRVMGYVLLHNRYGMEYAEPVESVHNYISFSDGIVRKGAISAHKGETVIIPLSMGDGIIIGRGRGNPEWNCSAPHGAGRRMSRTQAKKSIPLPDFERIMKERMVYSSTVNGRTLDEAPQAYKQPDVVLARISETVEILYRMMPVYNFKAAD
ncbi:MAG: RtcB family protein [Spirochaetota bacterium]